MNAIEAMQAEIEYQIQDLQRLELPSFVNDCLFTGSGDSYVAGLASTIFFRKPCYLLPTLST